MKSSFQPTGATAVAETSNLNNFDLFRLSKSKDVVDISSNTIRKWAREGFVRIYKHGKNSFASKAEVRACIMQRAA